MNPYLQRFRYPRRCNGLDIGLGIGIGLVIGLSIG